MGTGPEGNAYIAVAGQEEHHVTDSRDALRALILEIKAGKACHLLQGRRSRTALSRGTRPRAVARTAERRAGRSHPRDRATARPGPTSPRHSSCRARPTARTVRRSIANAGSREAGKKGVATRAGRRRRPR
ncbi:hypothetical protein CA983_23130 [Streptomyces swartbergensis]|uniref:Uncharacterized protein n=1 Tax=Streptomyces swartbergensis TaxID=487165 RepID=A0A243S067_9ACTN|nr:hypothetical protein CA983_23130 [Streptomyces swartbergensis]